MTEKELLILLNEKVCDIADALILYYNPCKMDGPACKVGNPNPCCTHTRFSKNMCPFWQSNKCNFRNVSCKIWFCETALKDVDPKFVEMIKLLEKVTSLYGLMEAPLIGEGYIGADRPK